MVGVDAGGGLPDRAIPAVRVGSGENAVQLRDAELRVVTRSEH